VTRRAAVLSTGRFFPPRIVGNDYFYDELGLETSEEWIVERTGIKTRHLVDRAEGQATSWMASKAARICLDKVGVSPDEVDAILVATVTPDHLFPSTACLVQAELGASKAFGWDVSAACSGFVFTLSQAVALVRSGMADKILVIGADTMSSVIDYQDRATSIIFGDGAGAFLIGAMEPGDESGRELVDFCMHIDGAGGSFLQMPAGGSARPASIETVQERLHYVKQDGRTVFKHAVKRMAQVLEELLERNDLDSTDVDLFIPHQANKRIIDACARRLKIDEARVVLTLDRWGNTTAATIPSSLDCALEEGRVHRGQHVVIATFGAGFTWGAGLIKW